MDTRIGAHGEAQAFRLFREQICVIGQEKIPKGALAYRVRAKTLKLNTFGNNGKLKWVCPEHKAGRE